MKDIIELIKCSSAKTTGGVDSTLIDGAEKELGVKFNDEYRTFLEKFGVLISGSDEIFGLGVSGYLNVVNSTLEERELHNESLDNYIVIQNYGTGDISITMDCDGNIYESRNNTNTKIYDSFYDFLENEILL